MLEGTVGALIAALDCREHNTGQHSWRVREISLWLARKLEAGPAVYEALRQGALLHDVGKIGIPDQILLKPGPLTPAERKVMEEHPSLGMNIMQQIPFMGAAAEIVEFHHERFDGTGYPHGLKGSQIPLGARIFTVVDVLDALTSARPYHKAMPFDEAKQWIVEQSGKQFDPLVVNAFKGMTPEIWQALRMRMIHGPGKEDSPKDAGESLDEQFRRLPYYRTK